MRVFQPLKQSWCDFSTIIIWPYNNRVQTIVKLQTKIASLMIIWLIFNVKKLKKIDYCWAFKRLCAIKNDDKSFVFRGIGHTQKNNSRSLLLTGKYVQITTKTYGNVMCPA